MADMALEQGAKYIVSELTKRGYAAYMVGGCVRDKLLHRPVKDYDIATSALPAEVQSLFSRTVPTGLQHGTVTVLIGKTAYEVTTFRAEAEYEAHRRPAGVVYIDNLEEDLQRRDFTMNAMAIGADGELIDPFGGVADLQEGILRCVGQADERFAEDALRMLRCIRFAAEYRLVVEPSTWDALLRSRLLLKHIAMERVRAELERMIAGSNPNEAVRLLTDSGALQHCKEPVLLAAGLERAAPWQDMRCLGDEAARWAYLFLHCGIGPEQAERDMRKLTFPRTGIDRVKQIVTAHHLMLNELQEPGSAEPLDGRELRQAVRSSWIRTALACGSEALLKLHGIYRLDRNALFSLAPPSDKGIGRQPIPDMVLEDGTAWLAGMPVTGLSELAVSGGDVQRALGVKPGPYVGTLLKQLLERTALGQTPNETGELLMEAQRLYERIVNESGEKQNE